MKMLKFRVWDIQAKEMLKDVQDYDEGEMWRAFGLTHFGQLTENKDYLLMQFTGFIDKNGKEVYEGDIVQYKFEFPKENINERIYKVEFDGCAFRTFGNVLSIYEQEQVEVIANIYENPNNIEYER